MVLKGTQDGTITDLDGQWELAVANTNAVLVFSFIGYQTQEIAIKNQKSLDVVMKLATTNLDEVVVVGYGVQRKSDLTGSVTSVKADKLAKIAAVSPLQMLQGKVAGVQIVSSGGQPGSGVTVRVRGVGTFNNTNPIYVVDGLIMDNIDFLNASDIESIEVLKDASASTIYGSRGANGVIMVTTKNAAEGGADPVFQVSSDYSIQVLQQRIDLLSGREFAEAINYMKPGTYNNLDAVPNTDWQSQVFTDGFAAPIYNFQISATGSTKRNQYYWGFGYYKQEGIIAKSDYERYSMKLNNTYKLRDWLKVGNTLTMAATKQQNANGNVTFVAYRAWPVLEPFQSDGSYTALPGTGNPLADIEYTNSFGEGLRGTGNFFADINFTPDLLFRSSYGVDLNYYRSRSFTPEFYVSPQQQNTMSRLSKGTSTTQSWIWENTLTYAKEFGKSRLNVLAGYTMQSVKSEYLNLQAEDLIRNTEDFWYINANNLNPNTVSNGVDGSANYAIMSYLFRVNYSFGERYLFTATYRTDGSSKFTDAHRYAGFPAVAVGWNIHNEDFAKAIEALSKLKFRASWGGVGNEKIAYSRQYSLVGSGINAVFGPGDTQQPGQSYTSTGNPDLVWETTYQTNIGFEFGFWENKFSGEIDYFRKQTNDILVDLSLPGFVGNGGTSTITTNAAQILNSGIEFVLNYNGTIGKLDYTIGFVGNTLHNEALDISGTGSTDDYLVGGGGYTRSRIGLPVGAFYGYKTDGVFQNQAEIDAYPHRAGVIPGDLKFVDVNNDGILNDQDRTYIGSPIPELLLGLNFTARYANFDLSLDFQGQFGNEIYNVKEMIRPDQYNYEAHVLDRWTGEGTSNTEPRVTAGGYNYLQSDHYVQDASFVRLRNLTVGYSLPAKMVAKMHLKTVRVYVSGTNIFTLTKYTGYTPEVLGGPISSGLDYGGYPLTSIYSAGLKLSF